MSFPAVVIDTTSSITTSDRPVYVYGRSGRCWKFKTAKDADEYFTNLMSSPEFLTDVDYLIGRYGESILKRLSLINEYDDPPVLTKSNYSTHHHFM